MLLTGRNPNDIARMNLLNLIAPSLYEVRASSNDEGLADRMGMPSRPRTRLEGHVGGGHTGRCLRKKQGVNANRAREVVSITSHGGLRTASRDDDALRNVLIVFRWSRWQSVYGHQRQYRNQRERADDTNGFHTYSSYAEIRGSRPRDARNARSADAQSMAALNPKVLRKPLRSYRNPPSVAPSVMAS